MTSHYCKYLYAPGWSFTNRLSSSFCWTILKSKDWSSKAEFFYIFFMYLRTCKDFPRYMYIDMVSFNRKMSTFSYLIGCKCHFFISLLSGGRKQTSVIFFPLLYTNLKKFSLKILCCHNDTWFHLNLTFLKSWVIQCIFLMCHLPTVLRINLISCKIFFFHIFLLLTQPKSYGTLFQGIEIFYNTQKYWWSC